MTDPGADLFDLTGKTAVVTGGTRGLGLMIAEGLVRAGVRVFVSSRKAEACTATAGRLSEFGWCQGIASDLSSPVGVSALVAGVREHTHSLSLLVNNAGLAWSAPIETSRPEDWDRVLAVNLAAPFHLTRELLPLIKLAASPADPGRIVNIGSIEGLRVSGLPIHSYAAAKAGLHHLTRTLARDLGRHHVTVNAIAPGTFLSRMSAPAIEARGEELIGQTALGRLGRADDIVGAVRFLASRAGAYVTGVVLPVDGGAGTC